MTELHGACTDPGLSDYALDIALRTGSLTEAFPGVLVPGDRRHDPLTLAAAALLSCGGGVLCDRTAAWLWGCGTARGPDVHVLRPDGRNRCAPLGIAVRAGPLPPSGIVTVHGLPVLRRAQVVADLLCANDFVVADEMMALIPQAGRARFRSAVHTRLGARRDVRGVRRGHRLCDLLVGAGSAAASELLLGAVDLGLPAPRHRFPVRDRGRELYRLQFAWPGLRIATETGIGPPDPLRDADLARRGWHLVRGPTVAATLAGLALARDRLAA